MTTSRLHRVASLLISRRALPSNPQQTLFLQNVCKSSTSAQAVKPSADRRQFFVNVGVTPPLSHLDAITPVELEQRIERIKVSHIYYLPLFARHDVEILRKIWYDYN
jgi:hypothetical protein